MTNTTSARLTGALSCLAAAGLTIRRDEIATPDGPITLTIIGGRKQRSRGTTPRRQAERAEIEKESNDAAQNIGKMGTT